MAAPFNLVFQLVSEFVLYTRHFNRLAIDYSGLYLNFVEALTEARSKYPLG